MLLFLIKPIFSYFLFLFSFYFFLFSSQHPPNSILRLLLIHLKFESFPAFQINTPYHITLACSYDVPNRKNHSKHQLHKLQLSTYPSRVCDTFSVLFGIYNRVLFSESLNTITLYMRMQLRLRSEKDFSSL